MSARWWLVLALAMGCESSRDDCRPSRETFTSDIRPLVERYCGNCHGETPNFGAPVSLLEFDDLLARDGLGHRTADRIAARLAAGDMPPLGMPRVPEEAADAIAAWASCGEVNVAPRAGLTSSARPFVAPAEPPAATELFELRAGEHPVGPDVRDEYQCFVVDLDIPADRFVRRFEMVLDETRVLHHAILSRDTRRLTTPGTFRCNRGLGIVAGSDYLYTWAPGQSALQFPEGGLRVRAGDRLVLQIHYNNGSGLPDVRDDSGVRLYLGPTAGTEYGMLGVGSTNFQLPPHVRTTVEGRCEVTEAMTVLAGMPHMHQLGSSFAQTVVEGAGEPVPWLEITGWSFESQQFYALPRTLAPGDVVETRCTFENSTSEEVGFGERTADEMCNAYLYVTPPPSQLYCDVGNPDRPSNVAYVPGECLGDQPMVEAPLVRGGWTETPAPPALPLTSGPVPDGAWRLIDAHVYATPGETPIGGIDYVRSYILGRGLLVTRAGSLTFDVATDTVVIIGSGTRFGAPSHQTFSVPFEWLASPTSSTPTCPAGADEVELEWGLDADGLTIGFIRRDVPGLTLWPRFRFVPVP